MKYIHYGHSKFDLNKFEKISNRPEITKPAGGFWASRIDTEEGWNNWCISNDYDIDRNQFLIFTLKEDAKVLIIKNHEQLKELPRKKDAITSKIWTNLDFEELAKSYDAIEVLISEDHKLYFELYGWDCDSIVIMNPYIIVEEK